MPQLDVSAALLNPYTSSIFSVTRRTETIDSTGRSTLSSVTTDNVAGVVSAVPMSSLDRQANFQITPSWITVTTLTRLYAESKSIGGVSYQPDIITWQGSQYIVTNLGDYSAYGQGFTVATCKLMASQATPAGDGA